MSNKLKGQFYPLCRTLRTFLACVFCFYSFSCFVGAQAEDSVISDFLGDSIILVTANEGFRPISKEAFFLRGKVTFETSNWRITGDTMKVFGPLETPDKIIVEGEFASVETTEGSRKSFLVARGRKIEFDSNKNEILIDGAAVLQTKDQTLTGASLRYSYETNKVFSGQAKGRVRFRSEPSLKVSQ